MGNQNNQHTVDKDKIARFRAALNSLEEQLCGIADAYSEEKAAGMLRAWTEQNGGNEDLAVAQMCELAYGISRVTFAEGLLILQDELRKGVADGSAALRSGDARQRTMADVFDILERRWKDFTSDERIIIAGALCEELSHVQPAATT